MNDSPIGFWPLDELSGTTATDVSGCGNSGTYTGTISTGLIPLVSGGANGSLITNTKYVTLPVTKDYYGSTADGGFADSNSSDNAFSLETWIYPKITTTGLTTIFADSTNNVGIFYEKGNIVFKLEAERLDYTLPNISQSHHIVATYSITEMSLYVDGKFAASKSLTNYKFTSSTITLKLGPTGNASDSFIVDAPAVYRYALGLDKILEHYNYSGTTSPLQVSYPDNGTLFEIYDDSVSKQFNFAYPANKPLEIFASEDLTYNLEEKCLEINKTASAASKSVVVVDAILTTKGRQLLSLNDGSFRITQFALADDEIDYTLYNPDHPSGSAYYGEAITNMPLLEAFPDETQAMKYLLTTLPRGSSKVPVIDLGFSVISLGQGASVAVTPQTLNYLGGTQTYESSGYVATIADVRLFNTVNGVGINTANATNLNSVGTVGAQISKTVIGTTINLTATTVNSLFPTGVNKLYTSLTVMGRDSGARAVVPVILNKNTNS